MRILLTLAFVCCALTSRLGAGEAVVLGEVIRIPSKVLGEERILAISTPLNYARSTARFPVLYVTDGAENLLHVRGTVDFLARNGLMPEVVIVGILNTNRTRDLTPTRAFDIRADGTKVEVASSGGAAAFLDFFHQELFPYVETHYRTLPCRIFAGHSFGGLLALHALVNRPEYFNALIAASPSLQWDEELPLRSLRDFFKDRKECRRTLYVTMGNEEVGAPRPNRLERLRLILSRVKAEGFVWETKSLPEETHGSVVLLSYYWGLRKVFEGWKLPLNPRSGRFDGTLEDLQEHYRKVGIQLGFSLAPPEDAVNLVGYQALGQNQVKEALALFRFNALGHPSSPNVHDSLGEALEKAGLHVEALASYQRAVDLGTASGSPYLATFMKNQKRLAAHLKTP